MFKYIVNNALRVIEKMPFVNLIQIAHFDNFDIVMFPKVGTRSIRDALMLEKGYSKKSEAFKSLSYCTRTQFNKKYNNSRTVVPVRDPFQRLQSCWRQKISSQRDRGRFYFFQYYPLLRPDMSFPDFLLAISMYEKHFIPLGYFLETSSCDFKLISLEQLDEFLLAEVAGFEVKRSNVTKKDLDLSPYRINFDQFLKGNYANDVKLLRHINA